MSKSPSIKAGSAQRGAAKTAKIPIKVIPGKLLRKPSWIRTRLGNSQAIQNLKSKIKAQRLHTVCEEAQCPNLGECFSNGTATFMIMGEICTRRCPFCDVAHGLPEPLDQQEPQKLADTIADMALNYIVLTSVDRDDLRDGGAAHFADCIASIRAQVPKINIEILIPDFRGRLDKALTALAVSLPDVLNHNLETVPRLYKAVRPGADYAWSLKLIQQFKAAHPQIPTKSGLMLGLGEEISEVVEVLKDLRAHDCDRLTLGQYLQPSRHHLPVSRYVTPDEFKQLGKIAEDLGFSHVASAPLVRSSYHAELQHQGKLS